jgi:hypothetical protein
LPRLRCHSPASAETRRSTDALIDLELDVYVTELLEAVSVREVAAGGPQLVSAPAGRMDTAAVVRDANLTP